MLQSMAAGAPGEDSPVASNYNDLAEILGVSRQAIHSWKQFKDAPKANSNGTHEVAAWREFMGRRGLKGGSPLPPDAEASLRARKLLAEVMEREFRSRSSRANTFP